MKTCCEQNAPDTGCNQGRNCPVGRGTTPAPAELPDLDTLLTPREWALVGMVTLVVMGVWLVGLGTVAGYVWARWLSDLLITVATWGLLS